MGARLMGVWANLSVGYVRSAIGRRRWRAERFGLVPPHLLLADPSVAEDFAVGHVVLAGRSVITPDRPIFSIAPPSAAFAQALYSFEWLRHFEASAEPTLRAEGRALVSQWMARREEGLLQAGEAPVCLARRISAFVTHSALLTESMSFTEYQRLLDHLAQDAAQLAWHLKRNPATALQPEGAIALMLYGLAMIWPQADLAMLEADVVAALGETFFPDGGPCDRCAATGVAVAARLVPLVALYRARQRPMPEGMVAQLFRIIGFVKMMQHPDGTLGAFNNGNHVSRDLIAEVTRFATSRGLRMERALQTGFERLENEAMVLIADTGQVPEPRFGAQACASALSFELSTRQARIVVNCGVPVAAEGETARILRGALAHSTVLLDDTPLIALVDQPTGRGESIFAPLSPEEPPLVERESVRAGEQLRFTHAGFHQQNGAMLTRQLTLLPLVEGEGGGLEGLDSFRFAPGWPRTKRATLVFHLHPGVTPQRIEGTRVVVLTIRTPEGEQNWHFTWKQGEVRIEPSLYVEQNSVQRASRVNFALLLDVDLAETLEASWHFAPVSW